MKAIGESQFPLGAMSRIFEKQGSLRGLEWLCDRWQTEQLLLHSDLNVTIMQPGQIVGIGGRGFDPIVVCPKKLPLHLQ